MGTTPRRPPDTNPAAWLAVCALLAAGSVAVWCLPGCATHFSPLQPTGACAPLVWHAAGWAKQPVLLWLSSLAQPSPAYLAVHLLALCALALLGAALDVGRGAAIAWLMAWPLGTASLLLWPDVADYAGLSGVVHAGIAVLWVHAVFRAEKPLSYVLFVGLGLKLASEKAWLHPVAFDPNWGDNVVAAADLGGAVAGLACASLVLGLTGRREG